MSKLHKIAQNIPSSQRQRFPSFPGWRSSKNSMQFYATIPILWERKPKYFELICFNNLQRPVLVVIPLIHMHILERQVYHLQYHLALPPLKLPGRHFIWFSYLKCKVFRKALNAKWRLTLTAYYSINMSTIIYSGNSQTKSINMKLDWKNSR